MMLSKTTFASNQPITRRMLFCLVMAIVITGCSHQSRYGRNPDKLKTKTPPKDERAIRLAKSEAMLDAENEDLNNLSPVTTLFVNGVAIGVDDVLKWVRFDLAKMARELPPQEYQRQMIEILRRQVRSEAESTLLEQAAKRRLGDEEMKRLEQFVDARIREIINKDHGGRQTRYEEWLRDRGVSMLEDRQRIRRDMMIIAHLQRSVGHKVAEPTRREIEEFYEQYLAELKLGDRRKMSLIDIPFGRVDAVGERLIPAVRKEDARQKIDAALRRVRGGEDFASVAKDVSKGLYAATGGDWDWVSKDGARERWQPAIDALYSLSAGGVSDVIESDGAYFIVKCTDMERSEPKSFVEIQKDLIQKYKNRQFDILTRELVAKQYENADVKPTNPGRFLRAVVEAAPKPGELAS
ncbi:MAG: peptidyl-prolyl cis-trans isomerase [Phycisphaerales bacterium]|nr:peptidyl-prolyl cis-trans isomerase [Phycisphaerales bacterium]